MKVDAQSAIPVLDDAALESVTQLIVQAQDGAEGGWDRVYLALYHELHQLARMQLHWRWRGGVRSPTSLVTQAWLRLNQAPVAIKDRQHLIALLGRAMRFALIDETRRLLADKRGRGKDNLELDPEDSTLIQHEDLEQLVAIDQALSALTLVDERMSRLVELRYFGGMSDEEVAQILDVTTRTIRRDWRRARAFLASRLGDAGTLALAP